MVTRSSRRGDDVGIEARAFAAEQQADRAAPSRTCVGRHAVARNGSHRAQSGLLHAGEHRGDRRSRWRPAAAARFPCCRAGLPRKRMRRGAGDNDAGDAAGFGDANQRTEVARILHVDRREDEPGSAGRWPRPSAGVRSAIATMPAGVRTGLIASSTSSLAMTTSRRRRPARARASPSSVSRSSRDAATATISNRRSGPLRLAHQVHAVEQQRAPRIGCARQIAERRARSDSVGSRSSSCRAPGQI